MADSYLKLQTKLMREYYKYFSKYAKGKKPEKRVAWVTSFTPIEILEALDILYYYPESYAAVIAASEKEQDFLSACDSQFLSKDCCSYSCCIEGGIVLEDGPRGTLPEPDILIATNNQCNTLPEWWNMLAKRFDVPLIVIDYPGESGNQKSQKYVTAQHKELIKVLEELSGNVLDEAKLEECIQYSKESINNWNSIVKKMSVKDIKPTVLFDGISFLITSRCKETTPRFYKLMDEMLEEMDEYQGEEIPVFWAGYPLWYHSDRYLSECMSDFRIVGANYVTWWNLDYSGNDIFEKLYNAYNFTFLNLNQESRTQRLRTLIESSKAVAVISLHNKSCKCDFVSAKDISVPQVELDIDMIDRTVLDVDRAQQQLDLLRTNICTE